MNHRNFQNILILSRRWISMDNYNAAKIIKSINSKYKDDKISKSNALDYVLNVFNKMDANKNYQSINALLHLFYDWQCPQNIVSIWHDIECYHDDENDANYQNKLSYAVLIKCLIQSEHIEINKCIQTLKWIEKYNYKLSIHGSLLNKLIIKCSDNKDIYLLKYIHLLIDNDLIEMNKMNKNDIIIKTVLINAYGICQCIEKCEEIFNAINDREIDDALIGAMMKVYVNNNYHSQAFILYDKYKDTNNYVLHRLAIKACINTNDLNKGKQLHFKLENNDNIYIKTALIDFYRHFNDIDTSEKIFNSINKENRNIFCINAMIKAYINNGYTDKSMLLFNQYNNIMDDFSYSLIIKACCNSNNYEFGQNMIEKNASIINTDNMILKRSLIEFFGKFGDISSVFKIFRSINEHNMDIYCINGLLSALVSNGYYVEALQFYVEYDMFIDSISHRLGIKACIGSENIKKGSEIIDKMIDDENIQSKNVLIEYYGHFGDIDKALDIFNSMENKDIITISSLMAAYIKNGYYHQSLLLYDEYSTLNDDISHVLALKACSNLNDFEKGRRMIEENKLKISNNIQIQNSLISFYGNCNEIVNALKMFDIINNKDIVTINSMMDAFRDCNMYYECIDLFKQLENVYNLKPDLVSFIIAIKSCTEGALLYHGEILHDELKRHRNKWMLHDISIQINLINMYGKCGKLDQCEKIFDDIKSEENEKYMNDITIWNAIIHAFGRNGKLFKVKQIYDILMEIGVIPNKKTYVLLINAYSHCGDINEAQKIWNIEMDDDTKYDDYVMTAYIDAMSRKGYLENAMQLLLKHNSNCYPMWMSLLSGCRRWKNIIFAEKVYKEMIKRFGNDENVMIAVSVLMSNMYISQGHYYKKNKIIQHLKSKGFRIKNKMNTKEMSSSFGKRLLPKLSIL